MATAPKADPPRCDVFGCGRYATSSSDGKEVDAEGRKAIPNINTCDHHKNWPHSNDAATFATTDQYRKRV